MSRRVKCLVCRRRSLPDESLDDWWTLYDAILCPACVKKVEEQAQASPEHEPLVGRRLTYVPQPKKGKKRLQSLTSAYL